MHVEGGVWLLIEEQDWGRFAGPNWLSTIMTIDVQDRYHAKQGRDIGRWTLQAPTGRQLVVYLKRHYQLPWLDRCKARLFPSQAHTPGLQEALHLQQVGQFGIPVPRLWAAGEFRGHDHKLQSFVAIEELSGMLALHEAIPLAMTLLNPETFQLWKSGLFQELARLAWQLHYHGLYHQDFYLCHFYLSQEDCHTLPVAWAGRVAMIDFHRLTRTRFGFYQRAKDLSQLRFSMMDVSGLADRDWLHFWKSYQNQAQDHRLTALFLNRSVQAKAQRYYDHNRQAQS